MEFCEKESACIYLSDLTLLENMKSCKQEIVIYNHPFLGLVSALTKVKFILTTCEPSQSG